MRKLLVLVVEDDKSTRELLVNVVGEQGHLVSAVKTMAEAGKILEAETPDLLILDRGLPDGDGIRFCMMLRKDARFRAIPVLMLTGKSEPAERVIGLRYGADDYLTKPFEVEELLARIDALVRRTRPDLASFSSRLERGAITLDIPGRQVTCGGIVIPCTHMEYELLRVFMERPGTLLTRDFLLRRVWRSAEVGPKTVDVTVMTLRKKLGRAGNLIEAVRGFGYRLRLNNERTC